MATEAQARLSAILGTFVAAFLVSPGVLGAEGESPDYSAVQALFEKHCLDCHAEQEPEGKLVLESFETLMKGGESGPALVPGKSSESLLIKSVLGEIEQDGKKKIMPPGKRDKLTSAEIAVLRAWIDGGAQPPAQPPARPAELAVPKITPTVPARDPVTALAYTDKEKLLAVGRYGYVELRSAEHRGLIARLEGHRGSAHALEFSADGKRLFAAGGDAGLAGEIRQWEVPSGKLTRVVEGHQDAVYALAISPDGKTLATGSYDQKIKLWNMEDGKEIKTLTGHNGAVFDLDFRADGKLLASASADRTVKLWEVASGRRRDTLSQSLKELHAVAFQPDGKTLAAGGVDNRIRILEISETAAETTNPLLESKFAHEGAILALAYSTDGKLLASSADDSTVKIWETAGMQERALLEKQPDWPSAIVFALSNKALVAGRLDGTIEFYDSATGKVLPPSPPGLARAEPRGFQRGAPARIRLHGSNLVQLAELKLHHPKLQGRFLPEDVEKPDVAWVELTAAPDLARGPYELSVVHRGGESGRIKVYVDDLPHLYERDDLPVAAESLPATFWGGIESAGDTDSVEFNARAGERIVFDLASKSIGGKANAVLTLSDADGRVLASNNDFPGGDPFLTHKFESDGRYRIEIKDLLLGNSPEHFYRLSFGAFAYVTGIFPLSAPAGGEREIELIGHNLSPAATVKAKAEKPGEVEVPLDPDKFRSRGSFKLIASDLPELVEAEPNDQPEQATAIPAPGSVCGRLWNANGAKERSSPDVDLFRIEAGKGETWIIETTAAQRGSPVDTRIEVLHGDGRPVERLLLQAVRDSAITFRPIDSASREARVENWEEMDLNQFLYMQGEIAKIFRMPQGPDSGFLFYAAAGKRRAYFDTSGTAHALDEPCYVVEPHPPGTALVQNGLPAFTLDYANDDEGERKLGTDSKLHFTAPSDGSYLIRVTDTRGFGGERFVYRLVVRPARPDFKVTLNGANPTVPRGSGRSFSLSAERLDGFEGEVRIEVEGIPPGFLVSNPIVIQEGHTEASGTLYATMDAPALNETNAAATKISASAFIDGEKVTKEVTNFGRIKLGDAPKLFVSLEPYSESPPTNDFRGSTAPLEMTIAPGETIPARLRVQRNGHEDLITFTVENLPHGVIVDNIGLNGVLIPKGEDDRQIYLNAAKWVPETSRYCYAIENQAGRQTSRPVLLHVRRPTEQAAVSER